MRSISREKFHRIKSIIELIENSTEKHKSYHIKDEQLNRDGFKKFMKHEVCSFESCRFSRVCNHIHCIRPGIRFELFSNIFLNNLLVCPSKGCTYVLHSSGQLYSHKRKHERRENELAYRKFRLAQNMLRSINNDNNLNSTFGFLEASLLFSKFMRF